MDFEPGVETLTSGREYASRRQLKPRPPFAGSRHTRPLMPPQYWLRILVSESRWQFRCEGLGGLLGDIICLNSSLSFSCKRVMMSRE
jgi:hypothetical protein